MITEDKVREVLHPGDEIKNWKTLCQMFGLKECFRNDSSGKAIQKQMSQYCNFYFDGQKIIIRDIKKKSSLVEDKRKTNSKYSQYIQTMILHAVYENEGTVYIKPTDLWKKCGMVNNKYRAKETTALSMEVKQWEMDSFYKMTGSTFNKMVMQAVNSLKKAHLILFTANTVIVTMDGNSFVANEDELKEIETAKRLALKALSLKNDTEVIMKNQTKAYYKYIQETIKDRRNWKFYYTVYKITGIRQDLVLEAINEYDNQLKLNHNIIDALNLKVDNTANKQLEKFNATESLFKYPNYFVGNQKLLINKLVTIDPNEILVDEVTTNYELDWALFS